MKPKIQAWQNQIKSGKARSDGAKILNFIKTTNGCCTMPIIELHTGISYQTISGRISDLLDAGLIYICTTVKSANNRVYSCYSYEPHSGKQQYNAYLRNNEKRKGAKNKFLTFFSDRLSPGAKHEIQKL